MSDIPWLNGWPRRGDVVFIGHAHACIGCGAFLGMSSGPAGEGEDPPMPVWPFPAAGCPVCELRDQVPPRPPEPSWPRGKRRPLP